DGDSRDVHRDRRRNTLSRPRHQRGRRRAVLHAPVPRAGGIRAGDDAVAVDAVDGRHWEGHYNGGSIASSYSFLKRAISSAAGRMPSTLPMPWPEPQISFQAFGLARSPEASVPKFIFEGSDVGRFSGSMPAAWIDGFR